MEFLKTLFEKGALTWEQFQQAAKDAKFEVVNAAGGAYVPKADLDTKAQELTTATNTIKDLRAAAKAWDGKDPKKLEDDLKDLQTKYDTDTANIRRDAAIDLALTRAHARDPQLTRAALSMDDIKIGADGKITGLDAQVESLKKDKAWLFEEDGAGQSGKQGDKGGNPERRSGRRLQSAVRRQPEYGKRSRFRSRRSIQHQRLTERRNEKCLSLSHRQRSAWQTMWTSRLLTSSAAAPCCWRH